MRTRTLAAFALAAVAVLAGDRPASAGLFVMTLTGVTKNTAVNGTPIADGTPLVLSVTFDGANPNMPLSYLGGYTVTDVVATVGGTSYRAAPSTLSDYVVAIILPSNPMFPGYSFVGMTQNIPGNPEVISGYTGVTPALDLLNIQTTYFSGYVGTLDTSAGVINTGSSTLVFGFNDTLGIGARITSVSPEPSTLAGGVMAAGGLAVALARRRFARGRRLAPAA